MTRHQPNNDKQQATSSQANNSCFTIKRIVGVNLSIARLTGMLPLLSYLYHHAFCSYALIIDQY